MSGLRGTSLLLGEIEICTCPGLDANTKQPADFMITNWALRICYEDLKPHVYDSVIPHATIIRVTKKGGKKGHGFYGVKVKVSTCASIKIHFSRNSRLRPKFFLSLRDAIENRMKFKMCTWTSDTSYRDTLTGGRECTWIPNDFCPSYPPELVIPSGCEASLLKECSHYRTRERGPYLSYVYPGNNATLLRSSQPRTGIVNSSSISDQQMLAAWRQGRKLAILDCRPKLNAVVNQFAGGGFENMSDFENATFEFLDIPNIHRVRDCYIEMRKGLAKGKQKKSKEWGKLILQLVKSAAIGVKKLKNNETTLVHCTDGWDRTAQISALIQILIDPDTRTFDGFHRLIQKEWCDAGHMFSLRNNHEPHGHLDQSSPIFAQFIDAVCQILHHNENEFEFNKRFLGFILFHSYSQLYGDFMGNCWKDRTESERPPSLWNCLDDPEFKSLLTNQNYAKTMDELPENVGKYVLCDLICSGPLFGCSREVPLYACPPETEEVPLAMCMSRIPVNREPIIDDEKVSNFEIPSENEPSESS